MIDPKFTDGLVDAFDKVGDAFRKMTDQLSMTPPEKARGKKVDNAFKKSALRYKNLK